jgi:subtilisin family serine protease
LPEAGRIGRAALLAALALALAAPGPFRRPRDPGFPWQWALENQAQPIHPRAERRGTRDADVDAVEAWAAGYSGRGVVIALVGKGFRWRDSSVEQNLWRNPREIEDNGVDDDGNGWVDDSVGYDFGEHDPDPVLDDTHDLVVAEIAVAPHDGRGIAGVAPGARLMLVKIADDSGALLSGPLPQALRYAAEHGAAIIAMPWTRRGSRCDEAPLQPLSAQLEELARRVVVIGGAPSDWPACVPGVWSVQATDADDWPRGAASQTIDFALPGSDGRSGVFVSNAIGLAAGVAALLLEQDRSLAPEQVRRRLAETADRVHPELAPYFEGRNEFVGAGRVNVARALGTDFDGDGIPDADDVDADADGHPDHRDPCPLEPDPDCRIPP